MQGSKKLLKDWPVWLKIWALLFSYIIVIGIMLVVYSTFGPGLYLLISSLIAGLWVVLVMIYLGD